MEKEQAQARANRTSGSANSLTDRFPRERLILTIIAVLAIPICAGTTFVLGAIVGGRGEPPPTPAVVDSQGQVLVTTQKVWVALQPIGRGSTFVEGSVGLRDWPVSNIPPDVIGDVSETISRVAATNIVPGQAIRRSMLMDVSAWQMSSSPAIADGVAYFGRNDGYLYAVDTETGQAMWRFPAEGLAISTPAIANNVVYFVEGGAGYLYAVDARTGQEKWRFESVETVITMNPAPPVVAEGVVYFGSHGDRSLYGVDTDTGQEKWHFKIEGVVVSAAVVADGVVYFVSSDRHFYAVNAQTGQEKWRLEL
jgi:outer membrane protein assembly factor BamB